MRVGVINFHRAQNYGAVLQAYALENALRSLGHVCQTLDYRSPVIEQEYVLEQKLRFNNPKNAAKSFIRLMTDPEAPARKSLKFQAFLKERLHLTPSYQNEDELKGCLDDFDAFVCGSDQVWNPNLIKGDMAYTLSFVPCTKRKVAYAASFGVERLTGEQAAMLSPHIISFDHLSVREATGSRIVEEITGREAQAVLDPTLLLDLSLIHI
ncbi:MAG: polysaccharide pyruvyl transferase family protein, partial [Clostridia bacterium]|nr:polysaccharide pyruvyl transferase family protein [Clostridia bacterium]